MILMIKNYPPQMMKLILILNTRAKNKEIFVLYVKNYHLLDVLYLVDMHVHVAGAING